MVSGAATDALERARWTGALFDVHGSRLRLRRAQPEWGEHRRDLQAQRWKVNLDVLAAAVDHHHEVVRVADQAVVGRPRRRRRRRALESPIAFQAPVACSPNAERAMLASRGDRMPPCGVPAPVPCWNAATARSRESQSQASPPSLRASPGDRCETHSDHAVAALHDVSPVTGLVAHHLGGRHWALYRGGLRRRFTRPLAYSPIRSTAGWRPRSAHSPIRSHGMHGGAEAYRSCKLPRILDSARRRHPPT